MNPRPGEATMNRVAMQPAMLTVLAVAVTVACVAGSSAGGETPAAPSLLEAMARLKVPPDWFDATPVKWDTSRPWKDARLEIRRLLAADDEVSSREAVKLTLLYARKGDIGDGHELPMYLFLSGNYAWALQEYATHVKKVEGKGATHAYLCYASCYAHFGEYAKALEILNAALADLPPKPWRISATANIHNQLGDVSAKMGDVAKAKEHYAQAISLYPTSDQPYGRHLLPRHAAKVQSKLDLLTMQSLKDASLRDGTYTGKSLGYSDTRDIEVLVTIANGKIADIKVTHEEKIDLRAAEIMPERIKAAQSFRVDAVTGATVTSQAVIDGAYRALKQAGLK